MTAAVVEAVARATDTDPVDLKPIGRIVDPDALDALFVPPVSGPSQGDGSITSEYGVARSRFTATASSSAWG